MDSPIYIGLMSGTSVDGLDVCAVRFAGTNYEILAAESIPYPADLHDKLLNAHTLSALELAQLHVDFGVYCGREVRDFVKKHSICADYVASHGQTVFHTPQTGLTLQIGSGAHIAAECGISTICDFRTLDVAMGGQGAPLVPIGDELLFPEYDYCLNIGGFANVSTSVDGKRIAWDICPSNIVLNSFAQKLGYEFDKDGQLGRKGTVNEQILRKLNNLSYYASSAPKSLGREWVEQEILPILSQGKSLYDCLATYYEHCAMQIGKTLQGKDTKTLCTGGGVKNSLLMEKIAKYAQSQLVIPDEQVIDFKEALIFAYLGYLRVEGKPNCLATVTGARRDVCGGVVWHV
ncbi:MAG: anhydro-N-acetylmuramic acid kinase [Bacteroidales bacterium]|nr:anhydro-N-acetylmuramic acid kinase [Bacteroidales bacterium]